MLETASGNENSNVNGKEIGILEKGITSNTLLCGQRIETKNFSSMPGAGTRPCTAKGAKISSASGIRDSLEQLEHHKIGEFALL